MTAAAAAVAAPSQATTFAELWDELKTDALNAWQVVKSDVQQWEGAIVPVVKADLVTVLGQFKTVALNTVMQLATAEFANLTGAQKNTITTNTIVQAALANGKQIGIQDAQMLAQQAYNGLGAAVAALGGPAAPAH